MNSYLDELYQHQEWADAEYWRAFEAHPAALDDKAIRERVLHIHLVQRAFLWVVGPRTAPFEMIKPEDFPTMTDLKINAQQYHVEIARILKGMPAARMEELVDVPWFRSLTISVRHALMQCAMHSHYHRGQNATRLRELGGTPPMTDFIVWLRDGQPPARWS
jgi:uncharacterized damage-inducible protein DinB